MPNKKRKIIQFFEMGFEGGKVALCDDGAVFAFNLSFDKKGNSVVTWNRKIELEEPQEEVKP